MAPAAWTHRLRVTGPDVRSRCLHLDRLTMVVEDIGLAGEQDTDDPPLISVVVPVRNGMPWLDDQLRALSAQEVSVSWEVMVADNGSDDGSPACVKQWSERDPRIHLIAASAR